MFSQNKFINVDGVPHVEVCLAEHLKKSKLLSSALASGAKLLVNTNTGVLHLWREPKLASIPMYWYNLKNTWLSLPDDIEAALSVMALQAWGGHVRSRSSPTLGLPFNNVNWRIFETQMRRFYAETGKWSISCHRRTSGQIEGD